MTHDLPDMYALGSGGLPTDISLSSKFQEWLIDVTVGVITRLKGHLSLMRI